MTVANFRAAVFRVHKLRQSAATFISFSLHTATAKGDDV